MATGGTSKELGRKVLVGTIWSSIERFGSLALQFAVNVVLARLLTPGDFGYIAVLALFMAVSQVLIDGGFATALIQKDNPSQSDYSVTFVWNTALATFFYIILYVTAPLIASFENMPPLTSIIRVFCLSLIISALAQVQIIRLRHRLAFGRIAVINLGAYAAGGVLGIYLAYNGFGAWALVWMQIANSSVAAVSYNVLSRWHPGWHFNRQSFRSLFGYGGYLLAATIFQEMCRNIQTLIMGWKYSATQVGLYGQAHKLDQINSYAIPQVLVQVMFPFFSRIQTDRERLAIVLGKCVRITALFIFPLIALLIVIAEPIIIFVFGDQWRQCAPYFQILCVGGLFASLQNINFFAVAARGESRALFNWSFYKWGSLLILILLGMNFGMFGMMWAMAISNANIYFVNALLARRFVGYPLREQIRSLFPFVGSCLVAAAAVLSIYSGEITQGTPGTYLWPVVFLFVGVYVAIVFLFRFRVLTDIKYIYYTVIKK
ncbi:MAG: lipopolysaccharide biosynthesis protein [Muribaculum sp.]|nr:lipopolysaccharide biosynthesis protein [Muribaculaceae bacterium]MCM1081587.1 lipopolysaccharide biosynthesis protein [Muribaculum sp.]